MNGNVTYNGSQLLSGAINVNTTGNIQALNVQVTENGERTITPPEGVDGYAPITIDTNVPIPEPVLDTLNVTSNGTYTPPSGVDGYDEVNVSVPTPEPVLDTLNVTSNGTYTPPSGVDGYDEVNVSVPTPEPVLDTLNVTSNGTYTPPSGVDGYDEVNVSVPTTEPVLDTLNVTSNGTYTPPSGVDGYDEVNVSISGYTIKTPSTTPTSIASFTDGTANPLKSLTVSIEPVQAGSGDPSPTNVRPISGWTEEVITVADDTTSPTVEQTYTIPFTDSQGNPVEVYGGSVDVVNGEVSVNRALITFNGSENWKKSSSGNMYYLTLNPTTFPYVKNNLTYNMANSYKFKGFTISGYFTFLNDGEYLLYDYQDGQTAREIAIKNLSISTVEDFKASLANNPLEVIYELATPSTFTSQPTSIKSLDGVNNVFASTGDVEELKYFADL